MWARRRQRQAVEGWNAWDRLPEIAVPVLVLHGTDDRVISAENARRMAELHAEHWPEAEIVITLRQIAEAPPQPAD
jgi:pimeloyl-ACP methyl ester carboxylesterase